MPLGANATPPKSVERQGGDVMRVSRGETVVLDRSFWN